MRLRIAETLRGYPDLGFVPAHRFDIVEETSDQTVGMITLRLGETPEIRLYAGHVGYAVNPEFQGHRYAARALSLLLALAWKVGMAELWVTCNPDNEASKRTCELAGGEYVETVQVPQSHTLYQRGMREKCRYRFDLGQ